MFSATTGCVGELTSLMGGFRRSMALSAPHCWREIIVGSAATDKETRVADSANPIRHFLKRRDIFGISYCGSFGNSADQRRAQAELAVLNPARIVIAGA